MEITPELAAALAQREITTAAVLKAVADMPKGFTDEAHVELATASIIDGILGAMAYMVEVAEIYQTPRDRRRFADQCRDGLIKFMKVARKDIDAGIDWEQLPRAGTSH